MTQRSVRTLLLAACVAPPMLAPACVAHAGAREPDSVPLPSFTTGDTWVFNDTIEKPPHGFGEKRVDLVVERLDEDSMTIGIKQDGSPNSYEDHLIGLDWSQRHIVDGEEVVTVRPFKFPMHVGQSWTIDYEDTTRRGNQLSVHVHRTFKVVGWQDVTVPAGTFHVLKVVAKGTDTGRIEIPTTAAGGAMAGSGGAVTMSGVHRGGIRTLVTEHRSELYYAPSVKSEVKSIEEQYNTDDVRVFRHTRELVSTKQGG
jgi:hypothetical protein